MRRLFPEIGRHKLPDRYTEREYQRGGQVWNIGIAYLVISAVIFALGLACGFGSLALMKP